MKRPRLSARERVSRVAVELGKLASGLAESGSKIEDAFWEARLAKIIDHLLETAAENDLTQAIDRLFESEPRAHDELADLIESRTETSRLCVDGKDFDILLVAAPILATSRFSINAGQLSPSIVDALSTHICAHLLAKEARFALADYLFSPDQLPHNYSGTWSLLQELGNAAVKGLKVNIDSQSFPETNRFLSDARYLVGAVAIPKDGAIFRWNEVEGSREIALKAWIAQGIPHLEPLLTGVSFQPLPLDAFHSACRMADSEARPYSISASVAFLQITTDLAPDKLRAVIAPFYDRQLEEYRISLGPRDSDEVYHGIVWPLLSAEDESDEVPGKIEEVLRACGVTEIVIHEQRFPFEFCDDCGVPLYPNVEGESVHAEMPEQADSEPRVLH